MKWLTSATLILGIIAVVLSEPPESEKQALVDFYHATNGPQWAALQRNFWLDDSVSVCEWDGVLCNSEKTHITRFSRISIANLKGTLPESFSELEYLTSLDLINIQIDGNLGYLSDMPLTSLYISGTNFDNIPASWSKLKSLAQLGIRKIKVSPGPLPSFFGGFELLEVLDIAENSFNGYIPEWIGNLPRLRTLKMDQTQFGGLIPDSFYNLRNSLMYLNMSEIPATPAPIPSWIGEFHFLQVVSMNNFQRNGKVPDGLWMMISKNAYFTHLELARNHLTGEIPSGYMDTLDDVEVIDISDNQFSGNCPITKKPPTTVCNTKNVPWKCPISGVCQSACQGSCF